MAKDKGALYVLAFTSEVYGDPEVQRSPAEAVSMPSDCVVYKARK